MVLAYYGIEQDEVTLTMLCHTNLFGTAAREMVQVVKGLGLQAQLNYFEPYSTLVAHLDAQRCVIVAVDAGELHAVNEYKHQRHMVTLVGASESHIRLHDPLFGSDLAIQVATFQNAWTAAKQEMIAVWQNE